jgi:hypothetical protein
MPLWSSIEEAWLSSRVLHNLDEASISNASLGRGGGAARNGLWCVVREMLTLGSTVAPSRSAATAMEGRPSPPSRTTSWQAAIAVLAHDDLDEFISVSSSLILLWPSCCWPFMGGMDDEVSRKLPPQLLHWNPRSCIISRELSWGGITGEGWLWL